MPLSPTNGSMNRAWERSGATWDVVVRAHGVITDEDRVTRPVYVPKRLRVNHRPLVPIQAPHRSLDIERERAFRRVHQNGTSCARIPRGSRSDRNRRWRSAGSLNPFTLRYRRSGCLQGTAMQPGSIGMQSRISPPALTHSCWHTGSTSRATSISSFGASS